MSAQTWLNDVTKAFQEKLKTTDKILPSTWPQLIRENWASGGGGGGALMKIEHKGGVSGTAVPSPGLVEKIYFNNSLTIDEVVSIITNANLTYTEGILYPIFLNQTTGRMIIIMNTGSQISIGEGFPGNENSVLFFDSSYGWNSDLDFSNGIEINDENMDLSQFDVDNKKIIAIVSSTPFVKTEDTVEEIIISGEFDGAEVKIEDLSPKWNGKPGTVVPNTGLVENVYFNTELSTEEVVAILEGLTFNPIAEGVPLFVKLMLVGTDKKGIMIQKTVSEDNSSTYVLVNQAEDNKLIFYYTEEEQGEYENGWQGDYSKIEMNIEASPTLDANGTIFDVGLENDKLTSLFSITPFEKTEKDTINILSFIEKQKLPNKIKIFNEADAIINGTLTSYKGTGAMFRSGAFAYCTALERVDFPNIIMLPNEAFKYCTNLKEANVSKCAVLGESAFASCYTLSEINLPSITRIPNSCFFRCSALSSITTNPLVEIGSYAFYSTAISSIDLTKCYTINVGAFQNCKNLTYVSIPEIYSISSSAFQNTGLSSFYIPNARFISSYVFASCLLSEVIFSRTYFLNEGVFESCNNLTKAYLYNHGIPAITFRFCKKLSDVFVPTTEVIGSYAFYDCQSLSSIILPICSKINDYAFCNCSNLQSLYLLKRTICNLETSNVFKYTPLSSSAYLGHYGSIYVPSSLMATYKTASNWSYYSSRFASLPSEYDQDYVYGNEFSGSTIASIPSGKVNAKYILASAFYNCTKLTEVSFPNCTYIGESAFYSCYFSSISFPMCEYIGDEAFYSCYKLTEASFPKCVYIGESAFRNCPSLVGANFPNCTSIGTSAFYSCSNLNSINFPNCNFIAESAFYSCIGLSEVNFPVCKTIGYSVFIGCSNLTTASFPLCEYIGRSAFAVCPNLVTTSFPNCTYIGYNTFYKCTSLATISFPKCTYIASSAFYSCSSLESLYLVNSSIVATLENLTAFQNTPMSDSSYLGHYGSIYVHASQYENYKNATNWVNYADRFVSVNE